MIAEFSGDIIICYWQHPKWACGRLSIIRCLISYLGYAGWIIYTLEGPLELQPPPGAVFP
jgi:hypothetical protein